MSFEFLSLFLKNTAIGRYLASNGLKLVLWLTLAAAVAGTAWYIYHKFEVLNETVKTQADQISKQQETIGTQKQQLADAKEAIKELNTQLARAHETQLNNDQAETDLKKIEDDNQKKHEVQTAKVHATVSTIEANPTIPEDQKSALIAQTYLDRLWVGHCELTNNADATCARYASPAPGAMTPPSSAEPPPATVSPPAPMALNSQAVQTDMVQQLVLEPLAVTT